MITAIEHVNIVVNNLDESILFYQDVLGLKLTQRMMIDGAWLNKITGIDDVKAEVAFMSLPEGPRIELLEYLNPVGQALDVNAFPNTQGLRHIAFDVDDIVAEIERLKKEGFKVLNETPKKVLIISW